MPERILPREFATPPEYILPLSNAELQELGTFTALWSQIDWIIALIIGHLTKMEMGPLQLMMENLTTGPRVNLLRKLCDGDIDKTKIAIRKLCENNGGLIEDRNHLIHGLWAINWQRQTQVIAAACFFPKNRRKPIPATKLPILSDRAAEFSNSLGRYYGVLNPQYAGSGSRPRHMFFGEGDPSGKPPTWPPE